MARLTVKRSRRDSFAARKAQEARQQTGRPWGQYALLGLSFVVLVSATVRLPEQKTPLVEDIDKSVVAGEEIRAAFYFQSEDLVATKRARDTAAEKVPDYYRVDRRRVSEQLMALQDRINRIAEQRSPVAQAILDALQKSSSADEAETLVAKTVSTFCTALKEQPGWEDMPGAATLALWLLPDLESLPQREFAPAAETASETEESPRPTVGLSAEDAGAFGYGYGASLSGLAEQALRAVLANGVRTSELPADTASRKVVVLREAAQSEQAAGIETALSEVPGPAAAAEALEARLTELAKRSAKETGTPTEWAKLHDAVLALTKPLVADTLRYDRVYTDEARQQARTAVEKVMKEIEAGEIVQDRGKRWTEQSRKDVETYLSILEEEQQPSQRIVPAILSNSILVALVLLGLYKSVPLLRGKKQPGHSVWTEIGLALLLVSVTLVIGRIAFYFEPTGFVLPIAATGILMAIITNGPLASLVSVSTAVLVSVQYGYDWRLLMVGGAMSMAGVVGIFKVRRRSDMAAASIKATLVGLVAMVAISLAMDSLLSDASVRRLMLIGMNGFLCLLLVPAMLSPLERLFRITTDIQLLEYSDLNNELLSQLAQKAGATYSHSQILGQLAEAAADAVGANGLLAKVCAYYHDIGKMRRSKYFSENQTGRNVHDEMSPRMSARAIASHVTEGVRLAREFRLPQPVIDGILEHHGTCLIGYFHQQALKQNKHGDVDEQDFRYPGPKPQRPESAILMICDAAESGVRSIKNPNEERVREFVDKIIDARAADGQFDECDLTMKQLDIIGEVVAKRIMVSLHTRVAYPEATDEEAVDNVIALPGSS